MAGVSVTTVSRVLNKKPDVSRQTYEKVNSVIEINGYNPNNLARTLVLHRSNVIGLVVPDITNPFFVEVARGIEKEAKSLNYSVIFCDSESDPAEEKKSIQLLKGMQVDGMIISIANYRKTQAVEEIDLRRYPVVLLDEKIQNDNFGSVLIDHKTSAYKATRYLIEAGHTNIEHLPGNLETQTGRDRYYGFLDAMHESNLPVKENWNDSGAFTIESGEIFMRKLLSRKQIPTAIFASNDIIALGAYRELNKSGIKIPEEISIMGHDNINMSQIVHPQLTTMDQHNIELGKNAMALLYERINQLESPLDRVLGCELVVRESVKHIL